MLLTARVTLILLLLPVLVILLQIFLSKRKSRWPGLCLPLLSLLMSLSVPLNMAAPPEGVTAGFVVNILFGWLFSNAPTAVLLVIYFACREKFHSKKELDRMHIQDL